MQNFKLLCSVTLIVVIFGYAHPHPYVVGIHPITRLNPSKSSERDYEKLRKEATDCIVGETKVWNNGCNFCNCVEKGVMNCGNLCGVKTLQATRPPPYKAKSRVPPLSGSNTGEPNYIKLRKEATDCIVGETKVWNNGCNFCTCVEKGVMNCGNLCGFKPRETTLSAPSPPYREPTYKKALSSGIKLDDWTPKWKKFFEQTASCKVGERRRDPDDCNWCECVKAGSMVCDTNKKCSKKTQDTLSSSSHKMKPPSNRLQSLKQFAEQATECTPGDRMKDYDNCNWCECIEEGVMMCGRKMCIPKPTKAFSRLAHSQDAAMVITTSKSELSHKNYYNLRDKSKNCTPDGMTYSTPCHVCKCIYHGAMKCVSVKGSTCDNENKPKKNPKLKLDLPSNSDYFAYS